MRCVFLLSKDVLRRLQCNKFMATAVLMIAVLAVTDKRNGPPPAGLLPLSLFIVVLGIGTAMGMNTSYAVNPARDLGPRILTAMVGYGRAGKRSEHCRLLLTLACKSLISGISTGCGAPSLVLRLVHFSVP